MSRDANGLFTTNDGILSGPQVFTQYKASVARAVADTVRLDNITDDLASGITFSLSREGKGAMLAPLNFGGFQAVNSLAATTRAGLLTLGQVQDGMSFASGQTSGTAPNYTLALTPAPAAYVDNMRFNVVVHASTNTGPVTLNVNGLGARNVVDIAGNPVAPVLFRGASNLVRYNAASSSFVLETYRHHKVTFNSTASWEKFNGSTWSAATVNSNTSTLFIDNTRVVYCLTLQFAAPGTGILAFRRAPPPEQPAIATVNPVTLVAGYDGSQKMCEVDINSNLITISCNAGFANATINFFRVNALACFI